MSDQASPQEALAALVDRRPIEDYDRERQSLDRYAGSAEPPEETKAASWGDLLEMRKEVLERLRPLLQQLRTVRQLKAIAHKLGGEAPYQSPGHPIRENAVIFGDRWKAEQERLAEMWADAEEDRVTLRVLNHILEQASSDPAAEVE